MVATVRNWVSAAFNSSVIDKNRHVWVDYLRGVVIILVVYHHAFLGLLKSGISVPTSIVDANMAAYSFRMPLFFIFSGIFTGLSLSNKSANSVVKSKFRLLLYPYIIWAAIQITLQIIFSDYTNAGGAFKDYLYIFYQPKQLAHFWYLPALFNATLVFVLFKTKLKPRAMTHLLIGVTFFLLAPFVNSISMMSNWMRFYIFLVIGDSIAVYVLKKDIQQRLKNPIYFLLVIPLFVAAQLYYFNVIGARSLENDSANLHINYQAFIFKELSFLAISLVGCATFIFLAFLMERWNSVKWLRVVGYHSLYIYIMHVIVVGFVRAILLKFMGMDNYLLILVTLIFFGVTIPIVFYNLVGKRYLWFLFSPKKDSLVNQSKQKEPAVRTPDLRIPPLPSAVNNI
jgi:fucose 4-O-acetylase-like acetyltransferase